MIQFRKGNNTYNGRYIDVDGRLIINPTEEMLLANGYERIEQQPTQEELLEAAIMAKCAEIDAYSNSAEVNELTFNGKKTWLTPEIRSNYALSINAAKARGEENVRFVLAEQEITLGIDTAFKFLAVIQGYADVTFLVTQRHKKVVRGLKSVAEVEAYDYHTLYPGKLNL